MKSAVGRLAIPLLLCAAGHRDSGSASAPHCGSRALRFAPCPDFDRYVRGRGHHQGASYAAGADDCAARRRDRISRQLSIAANGTRQMASVTLDPDTDTAALTVRSGPCLHGEASIAIRYTGRLNDQLRGFYLSRANGRELRHHAARAHRRTPGRSQRSTSPR